MPSTVLGVRPTDRQKLRLAIGDGDGNTAETVAPEHVLTAERAIREAS
jgi:hypothetical protein